MKADKIREIDDKDLAVKVREMEEQIFRIRFQMSIGQMDGLKKYRELKKDKARILTVQRQRQIQAAAGEAK
jgi:large subunit ribosomal protein L29